MPEYLLVESDGGAVLVPPRGPRGMPDPRDATMHLSGAEEDRSLRLQYKIEQLSSAVKEEMIKTAAAQGAVNIALIVGLNSVPIIGNIASALWAGIQTFSAKYTKSQLQSVVDDLQNSLNAKAAVAKAELAPYQEAVIKAESPAAAALALSSEPLSGALDFLTNLRDTVREKAGGLTKKVVQVVAKKNPLYYVPKAAAKVVGAGANVVGATGVAKAAEKVDTTVSKVADRTAEYAGQRVEDPTLLASDVKKTALTVTGYQAVEEAKKKADEAYAVGSQQIDDAKNKAIQEMSSPTFRAELRRILAMKMREDPNYLSAVTASNAVYAQTKARWSTGMKIGIGVGAVAVVGVLAFLLWPKRRKR